MSTDDELMLEAMREVDKLTPAVPPIAPPLPPPRPIEGWTSDAIAKPGELRRPRGTIYDASANEFELPDGRRVAYEPVARSGWLVVLRAFYDDDTIRGFYR